MTGGELTRRTLRSRGVRRVLDAWHLRRIDRSLAGPKLLQAFATAYPEAMFVEIGANDGQENDHLQPLIERSDWRGVMVEPVPYVFERLRANYRDVPGVSLENSAIAARNGTMTFFHLRDATAAERRGLPAWYDAIGSFSKDAVLRHADQIPDLESRLVSTSVPCLSFDALCEKHGISEVDLLLIDTEGFDANILRAIDFDRHQPRLVIYEHYHLDARERSGCRGRLEAAGYETMEEGFDTWCLRPLDDRLTRMWRELEPGVPGVSAREADG